jgi:hypothetical protein
MGVFCVSDEPHYTRQFRDEAAKALVAGVGSGTVFGVAGSLLYSTLADDSSRIACTAFNSKYDHTTLSLGQHVPLGCTKLVDLPLLGEVSSAAEAAVVYGVPIAIIVLIVAVIRLVVLQERHGS